MRWARWPEGLQGRRRGGTALALCAPEKVAKGGDDFQALAERLNVVKGGSERLVGDGFALAPARVVNRVVSAAERAGPRASG